MHGAHLTSEEEKQYITMNKKRGIGREGRKQRI
jgi:hypothetical protein